MKIGLCRPVVTEEMVEAAADALRNERLVLGESVFKFEDAFADYVGTQHAVSVSSGTAALTLTLIAMGMKGNEILTTPLSFVATATSIVHAGGIPRFADVQEEDCLMDAHDIVRRLTERTKGVLPVHLFGHPCEMDAISEIASKKGLMVVEDAAQAHGAKYKKRRIGSLGHAGCFSFYTTKNMTVGGDGGMVTTDDERLAEDIRKLRHCGRTSQYVHDVFGFTSRLNSANAAFGLVQLKYLDQWNERRRQIASRYTNRLKHTREAVTPPMPSRDRTPVFHLYAIRAEKRDGLADHLNARGVESGIHYPVPIHLQPVYREEYGYEGGEFPVSESLTSRLLSIPIYPELTDAEVDYVCESIEEYYGGLK
ncbi:MAG TPA: DegT/DnrJ/EryC1/StrS family aminotransferase [Methanomassiliicoccales archaeon]|nr:DegT/DnrJ/EryC1/StrS family aminotransferase [Methanomassiliicoccales archaeon]